MVCSLAEFSTEKTLQLKAGLWITNASALACHQGKASGFPSISRLPVSFPRKLSLTIFVFVCCAGRPCHYSRYCLFAGTLACNSSLSIVPVLFLVCSLSDACKLVRVSHQRFSKSDCTQIKTWTRKRWKGICISCICTWPVGGKSCMPWIWVSSFWTIWNHERPEAPCLRPQIRCDSLPTSSITDAVSLQEVVKHQTSRQRWHTE